MATEYYIEKINKLTKEFTKTEMDELLELIREKYDEKVFITMRHSNQPYTRVLTDLYTAKYILFSCQYIFLSIVEKNVSVSILNEGLLYECIYNEEKTEQDRLKFKKMLIKINKIKYSYNKIKISNLFMNNKFIIYIKLNNNFFLKNKLLFYKVQSLILKEKDFKQLFNISKFSFLRNNLLCIFINDSKLFLDIIKILENKIIFYSYKNCFSNMINNLDVIDEYNKYNTNYVYIQLILKKIIIKIIILLLFLLVSIIKYIKK